jgi:hypothetical protein
MEEIKYVTGISFKSNINFIDIPINVPQPKHEDLVEINIKPKIIDLRNGRSKRKDVTGMSGRLEPEGF